jgi:hypothetical protein
MCEVAWPNDDVHSVWREKTVAARKPYRCNCCGATIQPGEKCVYHFSVYDHQPTSERCCLACDAVREAFDRDHGANPLPSYTQEALQNCIADGDEDSQRWQVLLDEIRARAARAGEGA